MSEYQYYEFQALGRPLKPSEQKAVSRLSSRVPPHSTRAVFVYNYSSFPGSPKEILAKYYVHFNRRLPLPQRTGQPAAARTVGELREKAEALRQAETARLSPEWTHLTKRTSMPAKPPP
ncbi:MAG: hypothetical protein Fur0021_18550 [Candidatus Promineifilaceae bacterium]